MIHKLGFVMLFKDKHIRVHLLDNIKFISYIGLSKHIDNYNRYIIYDDNILLLNKLYFKNYIEISLDQLTLILNSTSDESFTINFNSTPINSVRRTTEMIKQYTSQDTIIYKNAYNFNYIFDQDFDIRLINNYSNPYLYFTLQFKSEMH